MVPLASEGKRYDPFSSSGRFGICEGTKLKPLKECFVHGNNVMIFIKLGMEKNLKQNSLHFELLHPACGY